MPLAQDPAIALSVAIVWEPLMKIATFNINGIKARLPALKNWLASAQPDVALLQEIKSQCDAFPAHALEEMGYNVYTHGQKSFNGVAILSKTPVEDLQRRLPGDDNDEQARWIEGTVCDGGSAVRLCCLYLPNGNPVPGEKYAYKLAWMARLHAHAKALLESEMPVVMAGDYNIIPQEEDCARPEAWREDALFRLESREAFRRILALGYTDALRAHTSAPEQYTFWDYQAGAYQKNNGIRIDHLLLSPQAADLMTDCQIDAEIRGFEKPSDHVPIWVKLEG